MSERRPALVRWKSAVVLGLISSTWSTVVSQLTAARVGRDAAVDWMVVAVVPLGDGILTVEPTWGSIAAGIAFHQWADFSWEVLFFGVLGRWTGHLRPLALLAIGVPWAVSTSAAEWLFLVPVVPFWQPIFPLEQAYWIGLVVHLASASLYPLFPWLRDAIGGVKPSPHRPFAVMWSFFAASGLTVLSVLAVLGWTGYEVPLPARDDVFDAAYMRRMVAHHEQGIRLALLAAARADNVRLQRLARLMAAQQKGDNAVLRQWWRGWYGGELPGATPEDHARMPGMLSAAELQRAEEAESASFDRLFVRLMTAHHEGAIAMADEAMREAGDPRLRIMAHAIRHGQRGEIALMEGPPRGFAATRAALDAMLSGPGEGIARRH
jgi:uncharacterized protein (DUF305 family)